MQMYHTVSNILSDYVATPVNDYVISPVLNFAANWGGRTAFNFVADNGGRALFNFAADWGGRSVVNAALNNPHATLAAGAAITAAELHRRGKLPTKVSDAIDGARSHVSSIPYLGLKKEAYKETRRSRKQETGGEKQERSVRRSPSPTKKDD